MELHTGGLKMASTFRSLQLIHTTIFGVVALLAAPGVMMINNSTINAQDNRNREVKRP